MNMKKQSNKVTGVFILFVLMLVVGQIAIVDKSHAVPKTYEILEGGGTEYTYLACTWGYSYQYGGEPMPGVPKDVDISRIVEMVMPGYPESSVALLLPEDCGAPLECVLKGIIITVDEPLNVETDGNTIRVNDLPAFIVPKRVEIVGDVFYGVITEIGQDFIMVDIFDDQICIPSGNLQRFSVTDSTLIWPGMQSQITVGDSYVVIGSENGVALSIHASNG